MPGFVVISGGGKSTVTHGSSDLVANLLLNTDARGFFARAG